MRNRLAFAAIASLSLVVAACSSDNGSSSSGSETTTAGPTSAAASATASGKQVCLPVPGDSLTVLDDDLMLQNSDNVVPAINAETANDVSLLMALDEVSKVLDTPTLIALNKEVDINLRTSAEVAKEFVADSGVKAPQEGGGSLTIGAANFSENITIAEIYGEVLRQAGYDVEVRAIGNRETYLPALISGEIDVVPEYAATVAEYLNRSINGADAAPVASGDIAVTYKALADLGNQSGIIFGLAAAAQDQNAFAVTTAFAEQYGVSSLTELAQTCESVVLGGPPECPERTFCGLGLTDVYGIEIEAFEALDAGGPLTKAALTTGQVSVGLVFSSDGSLAP